MKPPRLGRRERAVPRINIAYPGICLTTEENHGKPQLLRTTGCPRRTHSLAASPDLCATPDNKLPRTDSLAGSSTGSLCASSPTDYPGTYTPIAGRQRHIAPHHMARHRTDPARHRQHNRPTPQRSSTPVASFTSQFLTQALFSAGG